MRGIGRRLAFYSFRALRAAHSFSGEEPLKTQPQTNGDMTHLAKLLEEQKVAMLALSGSDGRLSSRPMTPLEIDSAGAIWMFTSRKALAHLFGSEPRQVNLAFSDTSNSTYISIEGQARLLDDPVRRRELWTSMARPYFPGGDDDPDLVLLRLDPQRAEIWDSPDSSVMRTLALAASIAAAKPVGLGKHEVIMPPGATRGS